MTDARFLIVGASAAGCALATHLARAGEDVLMLDRRPEPAGGVGESLIPQCAPLLGELGVDMGDYLVKRGAIFTRGDDTVRFSFDDAFRTEWPIAWQVPRADFDAKLRRTALEAGARLTFARARRFDPDAGLVHTDRGTLSAERVIDAAGRHQLLARSLGIRELHPRLKNAALTAWFRGVQRAEPEEEGDIVVSSFDGGWFWFIPFRDGVTSVGAVTTAEGPRGPDAFEESVRRCAAAQVRLADAEQIEPYRGESDFSCTAERYHGDRWALVGDAASFLDPVFSTGVCCALQGARWLADALLGLATLEDYERRVRESYAVLEPTIESFYAGDFVTLALSTQAGEYDTVRQCIVSLLAGDIFDDDFDRARRLSPRISQLARHVERTPAH